MDMTVSLDEPGCFVSSSAHRAVKVAAKYRDTIIIDPFDILWRKLIAINIIVSINLEQNIYMKFYFYFKKKRRKIN